MKSTVSEKGQITIPKPVRAALGLRPGTVIEIRAEAGQLIGRKLGAEDVFVKWRGRGALPKGLSVDAYLQRARGGGANGR
ncbi:MAG: AbrB/MazE/SpoVT family DNA-binding domain-containing protein [Deltaproteobacteria bacterium]